MIAVDNSIDTNRIKEISRTMSELKNLLFSSGLLTNNDIVLYTDTAGKCDGVYEGYGDPEYDYPFDYESLEVSFECKWVYFLFAAKIPNSYAPKDKVILSCAYALIGLFHWHNKNIEYSDYLNDEISGSVYIDHFDTLESTAKNVKEIIKRKLNNKC